MGCYQQPLTAIKHLHFLSFRASVSSMNPTFMIRQAVMQGDATNKAGGWLVVVFVLQKKEWGEAHV